ncbi:MAG TPA: galactose mutarotase, partial [Pedococcus sp.]|nr:galactose mutarotase [Pedococcus sp.]
MGIPASGEQWTIRHGRQEATVVQVGGGLRTYTVDGADVLAGYAPDEMAASGRGQLLMPWPNRIRDGKYRFEGKERQLSITEVPLHNASHGLVRWAQWELVRVQAGESA